MNVLKKFPLIKKSDTILLWFILIVAAILRFWNFSNIPFTTDELSALERARFDNFKDLINLGVLPDTHPAGIQVFLFYWIKLFGDTEMAVKLPYIIFGILSIYFTYRIAKFWFNSTTGIITAAFMTGLQYMVMYSQIERPYISGMFFSLLMVWCWTNYFFNKESKKKKWWLGYVVASALCAYNHHISLLFAATVGISGLFFLNKENWKGYLLAGLSIFILYIPHLNIFFKQLAMGGVGGWLGKPESGWIMLYIQYVFHFSYLIYGLTILIIILSLIKQTDRKPQIQKFRIIAISWFLSQFFITYFYSIKVNPLLQYSTLIFVFPFFLMFLFSLIKEMDLRFKIIVTLLILSLTSYSLIFERKHYTVFYKQPFEQFVTNTYKMLDQIGDENKCTIEIFVPPSSADYYFKKYDRKFNYIYYDDYEPKSDTKEFLKFLNKQTTDYFICGNIHPDYIPLIKQLYPYLKYKDEGFTYSFYCFSKKKTDDLVHEKIILSNTNISDQKNKIKFIKDSIMRSFYFGKGSCTLDTNNEYSKATFDVKFKDIMTTSFSRVTISMNVSAKDTAADPILVFDLRSGDISINWAGSFYNKYSINEENNTVTLSRIILKNDLIKYPDAVLAIFIWNHKWDNIKLSDFKFEVTEYNPYLYSLFEKF